MKPWGSTTVEERFWQKVQKGDGCWLWVGAVSPKGRGVGYGNFWDGERTIGPHVYSYTLANGPLPEGTEVDHVRDRGCTSTLCVRPDHLEAVSHLENVRRSSIGRRTHCFRGHKFTPEDTYIKANGTRRCKACRRKVAA